MTLQSFQVSCFLSRGFVPHRKLNLTHLVSQNTGKENRYRNFFFAGISVHLGDLVEQIKKKNLSYTLLILIVLLRSERRDRAATIIRLGFCDIQNNKGVGQGYQHQPLADNPYFDPAKDITKTSSSQLEENCQLQRQISVKICAKRRFLCLSFLKYFFAAHAVLAGE